MGNKSIILAVIVSYNGGLKTLTTINGLIDQVDYIHVVDNASDEYSWDLICQLSDHRITHTRLERNMGIGYALNIGKERANELNCDWLLTMDQDSVADSAMLSVYKDAIRSDANSSLVCLTPCIVNNGIPLKAEDSILDFCITSGNLLRLDVLNSVGDYDEDLFIDGVDIDYSLRLREKGFTIHKFGSALLYHQLGEPYNLTRNFLKKFYLKHSSQRHYYMYRNHLYLFSRYFTKYPYFIAKLTVVQLLHFMTLLLYEQAVSASLRAIGNGIYDFSRGRSGENSRKSSAVV
jgi:rhamnosyltransferase